MTSERYPQNLYGFGLNRGRGARAAGFVGARALGHAADRGRSSTAGKPAYRRPGTGRPSASVRTVSLKRQSYNRGAPRPGGGRRNGQPRRPRGWKGLAPRIRLAMLILGAAAVLCVVGLGVFRLINGVRESQVERFVDNVYVNGVALSGYTYEEGYALMEQIKEERLNTTYALTYGGSSWDFTPSAFDARLDYESEMERAWNLGHVGTRADRRQIIKNLKQTPAEFNSELTYDTKALDAYIDELYEQIYVAPVDAEVAVTETKPVIITASQNGAELDKEQTRDNLKALIETGEGTTALPVEEIQPAITSDNMEMKVVAKFSTDVSFRGHDSRANVRQALSFFNGYVVYPGDTCDFNEVVGPRTVGRGFLEAPEYAGNELIKGVGGGVCQASTTLYDAVIMANMTILERHSHNMTVQYVEPSQDAAVEYGNNGKDGKNFVFRNDTEHAIYIYTNVDAENATVTIYGTRPEYHYELVSVVISEQKSQRKRYENDYSGKHVYYITDKPKLKTQGHGSCHSEGWLVAYDWNTKEEVSREQVSFDAYVAGMNVYWRGVHDADGNVVDPNAARQELAGT